MEEFTQFLQHNDQYDSTDSNSATESEESTISAVKGVSHITREGRMPTRRPNPNVHNRNALLARENRRKKKAHLEAMEKELEQVRAANKQLKKALKQQMKAVGQLQREKRYFQSVIANHKEIENLIKALNVRMLVQQQSSNADSPMLSSPGHSTCSQQICQSPNILQETVSADNAGWNAASTSENSDNDFMSSPTFNETWSDLLDEDFGSKAITKLTTVGAEHSYAGKEQEPTPASTDTDAGICLHIRQGKVSLEFCPTCSWSSNNYSNVDLLQD